MRFAWVSASLLIACASAPPRPFPLRAPLLVDPDMNPVSVACRPEPSKKEPDRVRCAPTEYVSPFVWDYVDNLVFRPVSNMLSISVTGESANATSLDEVADSSWFVNRIGITPLTNDLRTLGACKPEDILPVDVADGAWVVDQGKTDGATPGFRVEVPGLGRYMLKADDLGKPERASAASVIGAALYQASGFSTTCEQIVLVRRGQFALEPGLTTTSNRGTVSPFDKDALATVLGRSTQVGPLVRMQASKWLPGLALGPFRYIGVRADDPNDVVAHENRRELRGSRLLAAWMNHWDAREQNSMDIWFASDKKEKRSSPGHVRHYVIDTSDSIGGAIPSPETTTRLGHGYLVSMGDITLDFITFGAIERPWDRVRTEPGREKFGYFSARDFDPEKWKGLYPNPAMIRMTERDGAWMARIIARFTPADVRAIVEAGRFSDPGDTDYLVKVLIERQRLILARYLMKLSPLAHVHAVGNQLCATDLARSSGVLPANRFRYTVSQQAGGARFALDPTPGPDGLVCFLPRPTTAGSDVPDAAAARMTTFEVRNRTSAGPLVIHTYDLGSRGMFVVGLSRR